MKNKLKTLKEFGAEGILVNVSDIREEAIKWVKAFYEDMKKERPEEKREVIKLNNYSSEEVVFWIKHFFNLTEEDLK